MKRLRLSQQGVSGNTVVVVVVVVVVVNGS